MMRITTKRWNMRNTKKENRWSVLRVQTDRDSFDPDEIDITQRNYVTAIEIVVCKSKIKLEKLRHRTELSGEIIDFKVVEKSAGCLEIETKEYVWWNIIAT